MLVIDVEKIKSIDDLKVALIDYIEEIAKKVNAKDWEFTEEIYHYYREYGIAYTHIRVRFYFEDTDIPTVVATVKEELNETREWEIANIRIEDENTIIQKIKAP
jgi:hypothetical protein